MVVHVYHPFRQPAGPNHCLPLNGRCSHFCLPAPQILNERSPKFSCACPDGYTLLSDGLNCITQQQEQQQPHDSSSSSSSSDVNNQLEPALVAVLKNETSRDDSAAPLGPNPTTITGLIIGSIIAALILISLVILFDHEIVFLFSILIFLFSFRLDSSSIGAQCYVTLLV